MTQSNSPDRSANENQAICESSKPTSTADADKPCSGARCASEPAAGTTPSTERNYRGRMGKVAGVRVAATGSYVPEQIVTNEDLAALGCDSEWIVRRTGIRERRRAAEDQATSDMCYQAALRCLSAANMDASEIDLIIVATMTPDYPTPSTACQLQRMLGSVAPAMDVNAACAGFTYAMITAAQFIGMGNSRRVLVVGADMMSRTVNPEDVKTYPLFGDGAGAVIMTPAETSDASDEADSAHRLHEQGLLSYQLGSEGCGGAMLCIPAGGTRRALTPEAFAEGAQYMTMDGRGVFKWAVRVFDESAKQVLQHAGVTSDQLSLVVLHQANQRIIDSAVADLDIAPKDVFVNLDRYGNTSAASIPLALDEAVQAGRIQRGELVLLCGFGAGLAWGTALLRW